LFKEVPFNPSEDRQQGDKDGGDTVIEEERDQSLEKARRSSSVVLCQEATLYIRLYIINQTI
jgi:hypothetical protein